LLRLCSFALHLMESCVWSSSWWEFAYPGQFAKLLHLCPEQREVAMQDAKAVWELLLLCEQLSHSRSGVKALLSEVHWSTYPVNQIMWRLLAHHEWTLTEDIENHIRRLFYAVGDTKVIEDTHNHLRDLDRQQRHQGISRTRLFADLTRSPALQARGIQAVTVPSEAWHCTTPQPPCVPGRGQRHSWQDVYRSEASKLPATFAKVVKSKAHHPRAPRTAVASITALQALLSLRQQSHLAGLSRAPSVHLHCFLALQTAEECTVLCLPVAPEVGRPARSCQGHCW